MVISKMRMPASRSQATAVAAWSAERGAHDGDDAGGSQLLDQFGLGHFGIPPRATKQAEGAVRKGLRIGEMDATGIRAEDRAMSAACHTPSAHCSNARALVRSAATLVSRVRSVVR